MLTKVVVNYIFIRQLATILDLYVNCYIPVYRQNNLTNELLEPKLVEIFSTNSSIYIFKYVICRPFWIYMSIVTYRHNNWTNGFLDLKLVEKEVLVEIFGQIVQNIIF